MKQYSQMKDSGIEWIGEIPKHWGVKKLKFLGKSITGLTYHPDEIVTNAKEGILVLRASNIQNGLLSLSDVVYVRKKIPDELLTKENDILICSRSGSYELIGKNLAISKKLVGSTFGAFMTVFRTFHSEFISKILNSPIFINQRGLFVTATINQLTLGVLNNFLIPFPPSDLERKTISEFLDKKIKIIDDEISKNQKLIELLKEKKQAVIHHAVNKGLDNTIGIKDSKILGFTHIPANWSEVNLGFISTLYVPMRDKPKKFSGNIPWLRIDDIVGKYASDSLSNQYVDKDLVKKMYLKIYPVGTVLCSCSATIGFYAITTRELITNQTFIGIYPNDLLHNEFLYYFLKTQTDNIRFLGVGATILYISKEKFKKLKIILPPKSEQIKICKFLDNQTLKINSLISKIELQVKQLKEFRDSLISSTITGKIQVVNT